MDFDHLHVYAADPTATCHFWQQVLGAEAVGDIPNAFGGHNHVLLLGGQYLVVSAFPPDTLPGTPGAVADGALTGGWGVAHLGLNVPALAPVIARLEAAGVHVHSAPRGTGPIRYVYFTAPDGVVVELTQYAVRRRLRPALFLLRGFNRGVHAARRVIGRALVRAAT